MDSLARDYLALAFGIERHLPGYVDAYTGPPELRERATAAEPASALGLLEQARVLAEQVADGDEPPARKAYLGAQVRAMVATCEGLAGEPVPYEDEVRRLFGVEPARTPEATFEAAVAELDELLPGEGPVAARMAAWRRRFEISPATARTLVETIVPEVRRRTAALVDLPPGEEVEFVFVADKPWSGYNWYLGGARSRVELNTDLPLRANALLGLVCHEAYPGHHTEHALREQRLFRERGLGEYAVQLVHTPQAVISEGIATLAEGVIFPDGEGHRWAAERLYPLAGLAGDPEREARIEAAGRALRPLGANVALLLHADGAPEAEAVAYYARYGLVGETEARQRLRFVTDPLWRAYVFTYHAGRDLLGAWLEAAPPADRPARFRALLSEQITPAEIGC